MPVLVAAASKHGATRGIADAIARGLRDRNVAADVEAIEDVDDLGGYDAVVLGSAVYAGRWLEPARSFVDEHVGELATLPVWLFSSGPVGAPPRPAAEEAVHLDKIVALVKPRDHHLFAGQLVRSRLSLPERAVARAFRSPEGDFRDWDEIDAWAGEIAAELGGAEQPAAHGPSA